MRKLKMTGKVVFLVSSCFIIIIVILNISMSVRFLNFSKLVVEEKLALNVNSLNLFLNDSMHNSRTATLHMAGQQDLIAAIQERDTEKILALCTEAQELYNVNYYTITDHKGIILGRTNNPDAYGDSINNQLNVQNALRGMVSSYYESGVFVKVSVRTAAPVFDDDGRVIGVIIAGVRFDTDKTVDDLKKLLNAEVAIFFNDTKVITTIIQNGHRAEDMLMDSDIVNIVMNEKRDFYGEIDLLDKKYRTYYKPLLSNENEIMAVIFLGISVDELERESRLLFIETFFVGLMGITISIFLLNALKKTMAASIAKSNFLANMSHEIRTPMNAIIGMTAIGKSSSDLDHKDICFTKVEDASKHLLGIINDILDMSKIEANKFVLTSDEFEFEKMLERVVNVIELWAEEKKQKLTVRIDKKIPEKLIGDEQRLAQVITNLLSNAVKFTPENGYISLDARFLKEEDEFSIIQVAVSDSGIGINTEQQRKLFNDFYQAESDTARKYGGTGLGLPISKNIVEMMGGTICVDSMPGQGSTFTFTVRIKRKGKKCACADNKNGTQGECQDICNNFNGRHILLAEDMEINREILLTLLEPTQAEIDCAENGVHAVKMFSESPEKYDLIIMDIQMPEMDGYEATRRIRALEAERRRISNSSGKRIPIIAMTANVFKEDVEKALESGMDDHIGKPLDFNILMEKMRFYLKVY